MLEQAVHPFIRIDMDMSINRATFIGHLVNTRPLTQRNILNFDMCTNILSLQVYYVTVNA